MEDIPENFILTRYLYSLTAVNQSLLLALLDRQIDEAMFWIYELYYSGFCEGTFEYLQRLYDTLYKIDNPDLENFINKLRNEWLTDNKLEHHIGSIVATMCMRNYRLDTFINEYFNIKCNHPESKKKRKMVMLIKPDEIEKYKTIIPEKGRAYKLLKTACRYQVRNNANELFMTYVPENPIKLYTHNWEYYAYRSPIWKERIEKHGGYLNHDKSCIEFKEDSNEIDKIQLEFYDNWGFEPDEQTLETQICIFGNNDVVQLNMKEFAAKYGTEIIMKKLKIKKNKPITNSIIYT
jgi:hypothetical protein